MTDLMNVWRETLPPVTASVKPQPPNEKTHGHLDAYWLAVIAFNSAAAVSEIRHKDPQAAKRLLEKCLRNYLRSPCVEPGEAEILKGAMK